MKKLKNLLWGLRYKRAVRKANDMAATYRTTFLVLVINKKLRICSRNRLMELIRQGYFSSGTTIRTLDYAAVYIAK